MIWLPRCKTACKVRIGCKCPFLWLLMPRKFFKKLCYVFVICLITLFNVSLCCRAEIYFRRADKNQVPQNKKRGLYPGPWLFHQDNYCQWVSLTGGLFLAGRNSSLLSLYFSQGPQSCQQLDNILSGDFITVHLIIFLL